MQYQKYTFIIPAELTEILIVFLDELGFEGYEEQKGSLLAYAPENLVSLPAETEEWLRENNISYSFEQIEDKDWNAIWEAEFEAVCIHDLLFIGTPEQAEKQDRMFEHRVLIRPQMAFGTGHHATTYQLAEQLLSIDLSGKKVLDFGSGTGVLSILAAQRNAVSVTAIDIDPNSMANMEVNFRLNQTEDIDARLGDINVADEHYDLIIANVTRNVLMERWSIFEKLLVQGGELWISGFYANDLPLFEDKCADSSLYLHHKQSKDDWAVAIFVKS